MIPQLYAHPFSSYSQKALIALYENNISFEFRILEPGNASAMDEWAALWRLKRFPLLVDRGRAIPEASIIEHLALHYPGPVRLLPEDPRAALEVRMMDRFFDNYIMTPTQKIVLDTIRPTEARDPQGVTEARSMLETAYGWMDDAMAGAHGRRAMPSVSPTAPQPPRSSTRIGPTRSAARCGTCGPTGDVCWSGRPLRGP
jgi:glutathione S-transferase